jgi:hypothetical protein
MQANFERSVDERLAYLIQWPEIAVGRGWQNQTLVGELFGEHSVRVRARLPALGEAEDAQSRTGGLLRRCVGAMNRSDEGNGCRLIRR